MNSPHKKLIEDALPPHTINTASDREKPTRHGHSSTRYRAQVTITPEFHAALPDGAPAQVVHAVSENCRTLRLISQDVEEG